MEYGGRLWSLLDKQTGKNLFYTNDVLQFRNLAVRNAWFSGGVEWNIGVIGHSPFTTAPLYTAVLEDGKVSKVEIPIVDGVNVTHYNKIPKSVDYFFDIVENNPKYIVNVDKEGYGLLQFSTGRLRSRKLFSWGHNGVSKHWQEFLTKDAGDYVEVDMVYGRSQKKV